MSGLESGLRQQQQQPWSQLFSLLLCIKVVRTYENHDTWCVSREISRAVFAYPCQLSQPFPLPAHQAAMFSLPQHPVISLQIVLAPNRIHSSETSREASLTSHIVLRELHVRFWMCVMHIPPVQKPTGIPPHAAICRVFLLISSVAGAGSRTSTRLILHRRSTEADLLCLRI